MLKKRFQIILFWVIALQCLVTIHVNASENDLQVYPRENAVVRAVNKVSAAVVNIGTEYEVRNRVNPFFHLPTDSFFRDFFDHQFEKKRKIASLGSGVIIDGKRGFILTNEHVIARTSTIKIMLNDGREFNADIVGADPESDLAVLRISSDEKLPAIEMGDSSGIMIGETVIAIGNPFGFSNTVTTGVISATNRSIRTEDRVFNDFIQTDASINPGNSGGPLLNIQGELIGINTAIYAKAQGIGFAIPINKAKRIISDLIEYGEVVQAWIGIEVQNLDERLSHYLKVPGNKGVVVKKVEKASPAQNSGIMDGDIILSLGKRSLKSALDFNAQIKNYKAGDVIKIYIWRNSCKKSVQIKSSVFPVARAMDLAYRLLGIKVETLTNKNRYSYQTSAKKGVLISEILKSSYLSRIGARPGDVIRRIDEVIIKDTKDFQKAVIKYRRKKSLVILLQRGEHGYYISVKI